MVFVGLSSGPVAGLLTGAVAGLVQDYGLSNGVIGIAGLAKKQGWRYTRYADDLTFSVPADHEGDPKLGTLLGVVRRIAAGLPGLPLRPRNSVRLPLTRRLASSTWKNAVRSANSAL